MSNKKNKKEGGKDKKKDVVELASDQSFPASDPPAWIGTTTKAYDTSKNNKESK